MFAWPSLASLSRRAHATCGWNPARLAVALVLLGSALALRPAHPTSAIAALCAAIVCLAAGVARRGGAVDMLAFGLVLGLGGWQSPATLFCSTFTLAWLLVRRPASARRHAFPLLVGLGLMLGASPWHTLFSFAPENPFFQRSHAGSEILAVGDDYADAANAGDLANSDDCDE